MIFSSAYIVEMEFCVYSLATEPLKLYDVYEVNLGESMEHHVLKLIKIWDEKKFEDMIDLFEWIGHIAT